MKTFRFECGYPCSSCYTEPDIRYVAARSRTLTFNKEMFLKEAGWLGVTSLELEHKCRDKVKIKSLLERLYKSEECEDPFNTFGCKIGTAVYAQNFKPFFCVTDYDGVFFTIRAVFAGRDDSRLAQTVSLCCD